MPLALILALAASFAIHAVVLFGPDLELAGGVETTPLMAELRPAPRRAGALETPPPTRSKTETKKVRQPRARTSGATPVRSVAGGASATAATAAAPPDLLGPSAQAAAATEPAPAAEAPAPAPVSEAPAVVAAPPRLPPHGTIRYRVDRGDSNFEIGFAQHEWHIADGRYRLTSVAETTGLVWLFKSVRIEMESRGELTAAGLRPQTFAVRRNGKATRETATFDWEAMTVSVADHAAQPLDAGAQDFLSFNYQLGYLAHPETGSELAIATGKKYAIYHLDVLGDETVELPAGAMRALHLRTPGTGASDSTELWLAYDYLLLPVKIRYVDAQGDSFVQVATKILVGDQTAPQNDAQATAAPR